MKKLTVLYDAECAMCRRCREFILRQAAWIALDFVPLQDPGLKRRFPGIAALNPEKEIIVISDEGGIYQGGTAWIMILYAMKEYRDWSYRLSSPSLLPHAKKVVAAISANRKFLSRFFPGGEPDPAVLARFKEPGIQCGCDRD